ncbi:uncharacterized protein LOC142497395 [Ascaphus truei]|uniref:uncharacterized protein LOC142497395 n=1 Tax=Ascaphus truei TaxID=8439 RepID=UPI003F59AB9D
MELYRNVMNEIHGALISLGYPILNPDMLLQVKKAKEHYYMSHYEEKKCFDVPSPGYKTVKPEILVRIKHLENTEFGSLGDPKMASGPTTSFPTVNPENDLNIIIKQEEEDDDEEDEEEEETYYVDQSNTEAQNDQVTGMGPLIFNSVFSTSPSPEEKITGLEPRDRSRMECMDKLTGGPILFPDTFLRGKQGHEQDAIDLQNWCIRENMKTNMSAPTITQERQRLRKLRFSDEELGIMVRELCQHDHKLFGSSAVRISRHVKARLWKDILGQINALNVAPRSVHEVKKRWNDLKRRTKQKLAHNRHTASKKEAGVQLSDHELQILQMLLPEQMEDEGSMENTDVQSHSILPTDSWPSTSRSARMEMRGESSEGISEEERLNLTLKNVPAAQNPQPTVPSILNVLPTPARVDFSPPDHAAPPDPSIPLSPSAAVSSRAPVVSSPNASVCSVPDASAVSPPATPVVPPSSAPVVPPAALIVQEPDAHVIKPPLSPILTSHPAPVLLSSALVIHPPLDLVLPVVHSIVPPSLTPVVVSASPIVCQSPDPVVPSAPDVPSHPAPVGLPTTDPDAVFHSTKVISPYSVSPPQPPVELSASVQQQYIRYHQERENELLVAQREQLELMRSTLPALCHLESLQQMRKEVRYLAQGLHSLARSVSKMAHHQLTLNLRLGKLIDTFKTPTTAISLSGNSVEAAEESFSASPMPFEEPQRRRSPRPWATRGSTSGGKRRNVRTRGRRM